MKHHISIFSILILSLFCIQCVWAADARDYYKVGVITSLSGDLATGGNVTKRGYDLWAKAVNDQGGIEIQGKKYLVKLVYGDAQSEPSQGASAAERLATQE
ncbi:MAG: ABC transporter substrate-binding protein, partial [Desulfobacter sp.]|nr:ABC transporter substrate-binding protein [Desulfobacter sp.]